VGATQKFGSFLVRDQIGQGGMATVHLADQLHKDGSTMQVALKRLLPQAAAKRELVASFVDEARLMLQLRHHNIPKTYELGRVGKTYYIAMEYVPGPTLKQLVNHSGKTVGTIPTLITLNLASQLCEALDHAHNCCDENGKPLEIVHRDVSPSNIILGENGHVKLIDFGLAKGTKQQVATGEGLIKGKFNYVAPEYLGGDLDARSDLWAVGVVMYELLTSRRLFNGHDDFETMARVRKLPIPRPSLANPKVSPELDEIVMRALERNPDQRWQTAADLRDALQEVIAQPDNFVGNEHVIEWVHWAFSQQPQRGGLANGEAKLRSMLRPATPPPVPPAAPRSQPRITAVPAPADDVSVRRSASFWVMCAVAVAIVIALIWGLAS
jgi:serine/threonine-protein kinase